MQIGTVIFYDAESGDGMIMTPDQGTAHVNYRAVSSNGKPLTEGCKVRFEWDEQSREVTYLEVV